MGHNSFLESLDVGEENSTHTNVTASTNFEMPTTQSGLQPKFIYVQAVISDTDGDAVVGEWVSVSAGTTATNGSPAGGIAIVVGAPGIIMAVHGRSHIRVGFPTLTATAVELIVTPLENA